MRIALVIAMVSILGVAAGRFEMHRHAQAVPVKMLRVKVVKDPVITADMLSPKLTMPERPAESTVASLDVR